MTLADATWLAVWFLAILRVIRVFTTDTIGEDLLIGRLRKSQKPAAKFFVKMFDCPYCIGFWVSGLAVGLYLLAGHTVVARALVAWFAVSWVAGHVSDRFDRVED